MLKNQNQQKNQQRLKSQHRNLRNLLLLLRKVILNYVTILFVTRTAVFRDKWVKE